MIPALLFAYVQESRALTWHAELGMALSAENTACVGLAAYVCTQLASVEGVLATYYGRANTDTDGKEQSSSATIAYSFEYTTSDDIEKAGNRSDMFLTPSLNIKFSKSAQISFDKISCLVECKEIFTWSLDSESNVPVCYYLVWCRSVFM
jgi:hypothetical protein